MKYATIFAFAALALITSCKSNDKELRQQIEAEVQHKLDSMALAQKEAELNAKEAELQRKAEEQAKKEEVSKPASGTPNSTQLEGPTYRARPANTQHGFINLRQFPNAKSKSLRQLYQGNCTSYYDEFNVRKVRGSKFYAVLDDYDGTIQGYVNGDYITIW